MKTSALQFLNQVVTDNKSFIEGNIADYLLNDLYNSDNDWFNYLTDEEIEAMNNNPHLQSELWAELSALIKAYFNYDISKFE